MRWWGERGGGITCEMVAASFRAASSANVWVGSSTGAPWPFIPAVVGWACVVRDANMGHHLADGNSGWCPELESRTTHRRLPVLGGGASTG